MSGPTSDWERVGNSFYRKIKLYDAIFDQDLELENYIVAGAPYGGAIGMDKLEDTDQGSPVDPFQPYTVMKISFIHIEAVRHRRQALTFTAVQASS